MTDYTPDEAELIGTWVDAHRSEAWGGRADKSGEVRERSAEARRGIAKIKAEAWDEGQEAGWDDAQQQWFFTDMVGDFYKHSSTPNPYRIEGEA